MKVFLLALLSLSACATAKELPHAKDCDGNVVDLHPAGRVTVVMASSQTLADTTREFGRALYGWQGRKEFRVIVVVDLRKSLGTLFKGWTVGKMRADLDEEAERLIPWYRANRNSANPRPDLCGVADFDGKITESLGWGADDRKMKVTIFGKGGDVVWSDMDANSPQTMQSEVRKLMGNPVPTPPDAVPKKSRILMRKG
ncbi:MAG: hypothetical protein EBQ51_07940 [Verrucomicrobia bacterium]|nr:hypothetical protein [Verrucomicrobiota bacterium]NBS78247.1 hypothetical protein [bacterium]NBT23052.1 hypothetical protein [bacterium]NBV95962.1 hypothetical protein [Verrucomicrobiota bacterium]NBY66981.1 hypothetical protein [Verrucomicrobiota bacterium]